MEKIKSLLLTFIFISGCLQGDQSPKKVQANTVQYKLVDLGESDVALERLLHHGEGPSLAPRINNQGHVIGNRKEGGFVWQQNGGEFVPYIATVNVQFHAINHNGDLLVSVNRPNDSVEWAIWPTVTGKGGKRQTIPAPQFGDNKLCFCDLTSERMVAGHFTNQDDEPQLVVSIEDKGVIYPSDGKSQHLLGQYQGMNSIGIVYGFLYENGDAKPAIWSRNSGSTWLKNYRSQIVPEGNIILDSLTMTDDGVAYGTYWVKFPKEDPIVKNSPRIYYNFAWQPITGGFKLIDIDGMQVAKVNKHHTLIGALNGKPAICESAKKPVEFSSLIHPDQLKEWEIIQISDINDDNHLVGIGKYQGNTHIFFAERIR